MALFAYKSAFMYIIYETVGKYIVYVYAFCMYSLHSNNCVRFIVVCPGNENVSDKKNSVSTCASVILFTAGP